MDRLATPPSPPHPTPPSLCHHRLLLTLSTHSVTSFIYCSSLSGLIPHLSVGLSSLSSLPPPLLSHCPSSILSPVPSLFLFHSACHRSVHTQSIFTPPPLLFFHYTCQCCLKLSCSMKQLYIWIRIIQSSWRKGGGF